MPNQDAEVYPFTKLHLALAAEPDNPAAGELVVYADEADGVVKQKDEDGTVRELGGTVAAGSLLAVKSYRPASDVAIATRVGATNADVDATNLAVTFTAPASGKVLVRLSCLEDGSGVDYWQVREGGSVLASAWVSNGATVARRRDASFQLTGLSAGSHTYKFGLQTSNGGHLYAGPTFGEAIMEVWAVP